MPQLNRGIQMLQEGRVNHLNDLITIFQSINTANTGAVNVLQRYISLHNRVEEHHRHHHIHHQHGHQINPNQGNIQNNQNQPQPRPQPQPNNNQQNPGNSQPVQPNTGNNSSPNQPQNPFGMLGGLMSPNSGFNFANIFAQNRPQQQ